MSTQVYVGTLEHLKGKTALVIEHPDNPLLVLAQFDELSAERDGVLLSCSWHQFLASDFAKAEGT